MANGALMPTLCVTLVVLAAILAIFTWTIQDKTLASLTVFAFGITAFATVPLLRTKLVQSAKEAPTLATAVNISAFNVANAIDAYLGGESIRAGFGLTSVNVVGAAITAIGIVFALVLYVYGRGTRAEVGAER